MVEMVWAGLAKCRGNRTEISRVLSKACMQSDSALDGDHIPLHVKARNRQTEDSPNVT
jgi:hypothetical protein